MFIYTFIYRLYAHIKYWFCSSVLYKKQESLYYIRPSVFGFLVVIIVFNKYKILITEKVSFTH